MKDNFHVELTSVDSERLSRFPLQVKLSDNVSEVPLQEWGAGTQNRTRVFISILEAQHAKNSASDENRLSPIFLVEEPESFLHPSAQAEFGQGLSALADEFGIQIIATTHSPYMLNQVNPLANYLLERKTFRNKPRASYVVDVSGDEWMRPFAENLGVVTSEFHDWKEVFTTQSSKVILVEGAIDKEYFQYFRDNHQVIYAIDPLIEVVPYDGKDALKNTALLRFMVDKFKKVFITFDLDVEQEVKKSLDRIGLQEGKDFTSVGVNKAGAECIEGLVPDAVKAKVHAQNTDLIGALMSTDNETRRKAKQALKRFYLEEIKSAKLADTELTAFKELFGRIRKAFA